MASVPLLAKSPALSEQLLPSGSDLVAKDRSDNNRASWPYGKQHYELAVAAVDPIGYLSVSFHFPMPSMKHHISTSSPDTRSRARDFFLRPPLASTSRIGSLNAACVTDWGSLSTRTPTPAKNVWDHTPGGLCRQRRSHRPPQYYSECALQCRPVCRSGS